MNNRQYLLSLRNKRKEFGDSIYLDYLHNNADIVDLTSKICVQIPVYNDPEIITTMSTCLGTAANPERIHFAICYQGDDIKEMNRISRFDNCKIKHIPADEASGSCNARYECNKLIDDEEYVLHIDSHMIFTPFWDTCLIQQWRDCNDDKAIISCYCESSHKFHKDIKSVEDANKYMLKNTNGRFINPTYFSDNSVKVRATAVAYFDKDQIKPRLGALTCAHCTFAKAELDKLVPFDPNMYFVGDEIGISVRYWTHGFNIYQPAFRPIYHLYNRDELRKSEGVDIKRFNDKKSDNNKDSIRIEQLYRVKDHGFDLTGFDIGDKRTVKEYLKFAGLDMRNKTMTKAARLKPFDVQHSPEDLELYDWEAERNKDINKNDSVHDKTIFVMIPSYKDAMLLDTIKYFRENADNPNNIHFGVCFQDDDMETYDKLLKIKNCKVIHVKPEDAIGVGDAYSKIESLYDNEDYVLRTESHMYALKSWDTYHIDLIDKLGDKAVISNWCLGFDPNNLPTKPANGYMIGLSNINNEKHMHICFGDIVKSDDAARGCFIIGQDIFGKGQMLLDCKHDPDMLMNFAEDHFTLSLWTHGYDVYHSAKQYIHHYYVDTQKAKGIENDAIRDAIRTKRRNAELKISVPKWKACLNIIDDTNKNIDISTCHLGTERTVKSFELFAGIDFKENKISRRAFYGHMLGDAHIAKSYINTRKAKDYMRDHNFDKRMISDDILKTMQYDRNGVEYID